MKRRDFNIADEATMHNLRRLEHLSEQKCADGTFGLIDTLIGAAMMSISMLPVAVAKHIRSGGFFTHGAHERMSEERRTALWEKLAAGLKVDLDKVEADRSLKPGGDADFADRKKTRAEQILEICDQIDDAVRNGMPADGLARSLEWAGIGTPVHSDARELSRLLARKRVPDWGKHQSEIVRLIYHPRLVGRELHHLETN